MADLSLFQIDRSNLPSGQKSAIRRFYEGITTSGGLARAKTTAVEAGHAVRQGGEAVVTGAALGAVHVYMRNGLDAANGKVPIDAVVGALGMVGGVALANDGVGPDLRNMGAAALSVFAFRKSFAVLAKKHAPGGKFGADDSYLDTISGDESDVGEDPIIAAARRLG